MIAIGDDAILAARALAREVYAIEGLRPGIDDATARVLVGEAAPNGAPKLAEIAEVRRAAETANNESVTRRLLASLGSDLGASVVIPVTVRDKKPSARVLDVAKSAFEPVELAGTIEAQPDGSSRVKWSGVAPILASLVPKSAASAPSSSGPAKEGAEGPIAPKKEEPPRSFWSSPWTWAGIGVVVTAGVVVFAVSQAQSDAAGLHLQGRVSP